MAVSGKRGLGSSLVDRQSAGLTYLVENKIVSQSCGLTTW